MTEKRKIEVFSAGCCLSNDAIELVNRMACSGCEVAVLDMQDAETVKKAEQLGIRSVPAVAVDGKLVDCCTGNGVDEAKLRAAGIGSPAT